MTIIHYGTTNIYGLAFETNGDQKNNYEWLDYNLEKINQLMSETLLNNANEVL